MKWYTHAAIGANAVWLTTLLGVVDERAPLLIGLGALGALLPDIDATQAKIHFIGGGFLKPLGQLSYHRRFFHSLLMVALLGLVSYLFLEHYFPGVSVCLTFGYLSHTLIDGFNFKGVYYLFPFVKKEYHLLPQWLRTPIGGLADHLLFIAGIAGITIFLLLYQNYFINFNALPL